MQVDGQTALHMAAANGHTDVVNVVLASGANVSATTTVNTTTVRGHHVSRVCSGPVATRDACAARVYGGPQRTRCIGLVVWQRSLVASPEIIAFLREPPFAPVVS